jgi:DNA polymerase III epsilon subunit-like protein
MTRNGPAPTTAREAALHYILQGRLPIPVPYASKNPGQYDWTGLRVTRETLDDYFPLGKRQNVALLTGAREVVVDLDCVEAIRAAPLLLPATGCQGGRPSRPRSHWHFVITDDPPSKARDSYCDPITEKKNKLVEILSTGACALSSPSKHDEDDEFYVWYADGPAGRVSRADLQGAARCLAAAALLGRYWREGSRHDCALALAGGLVRADWTETDVKRFIEAVCAAAEDDEVADRVQTVVDTAAKYDAGEDVTGWPSLAKSLGTVGDAVVRCVRAWLGIKRERPDSSRAVLTRMAEVDACEVSWLWPGRIPAGRITLLVGRPGEGKSFVAIDAAARVSMGASWPDGMACAKGSVILISAEDDPNDTIRPRLDAHGADVDRVYLLSAVRYADGSDVRERMISLADLDAIEDALARIRDCKLLVVDPIGSFLGGRVDAHRDNEVRSVLAPIAVLARKYGPAVLAVGHHRKASGAFADDLTLGSRAFGAIARATWHLTRDPDNRTRRLLLPGKNNLGPEGEGLAFTVGGSPARVTWEAEPIAWTADDGVAASAAGGEKPGPEAEALTAAIEWLQTALAKGPRPVTELMDAWRNGEQGSQRTLERAKRALGVIAERPEVLGPWLWRLPPDESPPQTPPDREPNDPDAHPANPTPPQTANPPKKNYLGGLGGLGQNKAKTANSAPANPQSAKIDYLGGLDSTDTPPDTLPYLLVTRPSDLALVATAIEQSTLVGLDIETSGLNPRTDRIRLLSLCCDTPDGGALTFLVDCLTIDPSPLWDALAAVPVVGHNLLFDLSFLARLGFQPGACRDTMLMSRVLFAGDRKQKHALADCCRRELDEEVDKELQTSDWSEDLTPEQLAYAARDAELPRRLHDALQAKLTEAELTDTATLENRALPAVAWLSSSGVAFDRETWLALAAEATAEAERLAVELDKAAPLCSQPELFGSGWKWTSPKHVAEVLKKIGHPGTKADDNTLAEIDAPLAALLRDYRAAKKRASTYGLKWLKGSEHNGRIYAG